MTGLEDMSWEQRWWAAFDALCRMRMRAEDAEARVAELENPGFKPTRCWEQPGVLTPRLFRP